MPTPYSRERSRSPRRGPKPSSGGGFKWKDKAPREPRDDNRRDQYRDRDHDRSSAGSRYSSTPRNDSDRRRDSDRRHDDSRPDSDRRTQDSSSKPKSSSDTTSKAASTSKPAAPPPQRAAAPTEAMIIVHVNDRLGTKAAIPCLASDPVKAFKAMVAARIGRQPHEIMLKRQGERPFKDMLTLEDYGVSNGVQLDLELDTGD